MAKIEISDLNLIGFDLFQGEESFLNDLTDDVYIRGGAFTTPATNISVIDIPVSEDIFSQSISFVY
ncbi:MAG: hypothetical protein AB4080_15565 [Trichodesmium sp.]